jgi:hypothetical protein
VQGFTPTESTNYALWKATNKLKQAKKPCPPLRTSQGTWARSNVEKAHASAEHLPNVFPATSLRKMNLKRKKDLYNFSRPPTN